MQLNQSTCCHSIDTTNLTSIVVPLVCAFFIDLVNALLIPFFLGNF